METSIGDTTIFDVTYDSIHELGPNILEARMRLTFAPGAPQSTSEVPGFADRLTEQLPMLRIHRCDNGTARSFEMELQNTEIAHAFEHVCIELLAQGNSELARDSFVGKTGFNFGKDGPGVYRVVISGFSSAEEIKQTAASAARIVMQSLCRV